MAGWLDSHMIIDQLIDLVDARWVGKICASVFLNKMLPYVLFFSSLLISAYGEGEIVFLQAPSSISFHGQQQLPLSLVKDVLTAAMGFSVQEGSDWRGMKVKDPFHYPYGIVGVSVPGLSSLDVSQGHKFPLDTDSPLDDVWSALEWRVAERFPYSENESVYYFSLDEGKIASEIHLGQLDVEPVDLSVLKHLNPDVSYDKQFIEQYALLNAIAKKIEKEGVVNNDGIPDIYWIVVPGLHPLIDRYGSKSKPVFEAKKLINASLQKLTAAFKKAYDSKVVVAALASDSVHTRRYRRDVAAATSDKVKFNLAEEYSQDFPVMFNIFLWFGIAYVFALLAVSLGIADMDPGRDSIIYRMTSNRMKKDN
ncbi:ATPase H(+)-transporting accessory protein 2 [Lycorma delicatula]|uniref:ATPase H(+)-transporting accessory protein 2 n=1 Tax=Lycorma delicatula TaxID=130591 RepID=UPI003F5170F5